MRVQQLCAEVATSEVSVIPFVIFWGYKGYPEFLENIQQTIRNEIAVSKYTEMPLTYNCSRTNILMDIIKAENRNFNELIAKYSPQVMSDVITLLGKTEKVVVIGLRLSAPLADYWFIRALSKEVIVIVFRYHKFPARTLEIVGYPGNFSPPPIQNLKDWAKQ